MILTANDLDDLIKNIRPTESVGIHINLNDDNLCSTTYYAYNHKKSPDVKWGKKVHESQTQFLQKINTKENSTDLDLVILDNTSLENFKLINILMASAQISTANTQVIIISKYSIYQNFFREIRKFFQYENIRSASVNIDSRSLNLLSCEAHLEIIKTGKIRKNKNHFYKHHVLKPMKFTKKNALLSIIVPCRNEKSNIKNILNALTQLKINNEIIFIEGNSIDGTMDEIISCAAQYPEHKITCKHQPNIGKYDAVLEGIKYASGDYVAIYDADMTVKPSDMARIVNHLRHTNTDFINATRLIYPMEPNSMQTLNYIANKAFALILSKILNIRLTDTLCGTKCFTAEFASMLVREREHRALKDPFGDFELLARAVQFNQKITEVPVFYRARKHGVTQISRFSDGLKLSRLTWELIKSR